MTRPTRAQLAQALLQIYDASRQSDTLLFSVVRRTEVEELSRDALVQIATGKRPTATTQRGRRRGYLEQRFEARELPSAIFINEEIVVGPFCVHCGNPWMMHGDGNRCPNQHLHPLFPPPRLPYAPEKA